MTRPAAALDTSHPSCPPLGGRPRVLWIGPADAPEFRTPWQQLGARCRVVLVPHLTPAGARDACSDRDPDLVVLAQSWPGQFSATAFEAVRRMFPLARILVLLGSWCEGETRTGKPFPGALRLYWHQWNEAIVDDLQRLAAGQLSRWSLPPTASDEERLLADLVGAGGDRFISGAIGSESARTPSRGLAACTVAIVAAHREPAESLGDALSGAGASVIWWRDAASGYAKNISAVLFDMRTACLGELATLRQLGDRYPRVPRVVLAGYPRLQDVEQCLAQGATRVVSKPVVLPQLLGELERLIFQARS